MILVGIDCVYSLNIIRGFGSQIRSFQCDDRKLFSMNQKVDHDDVRESD